jgi:mRNA degradation ribonuclease J1/J2
VTQHQLDTAMWSDNELLFLPLGGAGEIGMNLNLYGYGGKWLMIDLGVTFGDDSVPGIDVVMPDPSFIVEHRADLVGLVLTHAHEDHIGAVPHLWRRLRCPLYATPFTASLLRRKLIEAGLEREAPITIIPLSGKFSVGQFALELITLTHSIPEPNAVVIRTPLGTIMHTGDWKFDSALREQRGAARKRRGRGRGLRAPGGARRAIAAAHGRGRARERLSARHRAVPRRGRSRRYAARENPAAVHRQPG